MNITRGKIAKAQRVVIYGVEGIGKSTLASRFPNPVFIDVEGSTSNMDVARFDKPTSYVMLKNQISYLTANPTTCKTVVIDTVDWVEKMAVEYICQAANKSDITQFGYGDGFVRLEQEMGRFLNSLSDLVEKGVNVVLTAHAIIRKFEQPDEMGAYDRYELKLGNKTTAKTAALIKEWADMVLFCNYKTQVFATDDKGKKHKAQGGQRVIYTEHHPAWDAKNRHGLPFEIPMDYSYIAHIFQASVPIPEQTNTVDLSSVQSAPLETMPETIEDLQKEEVPFDQGDPIKMDLECMNPAIPKAVQDLMKMDGIKEEGLKGFWVRAGHWPADTPVENISKDYWDMVVANWAAVSSNIKLN